MNHRKSWGSFIALAFILSACSNTPFSNADQVPTAPTENVTITMAAIEVISQTPPSASTATSDPSSQAAPVTTLPASSATVCAPTITANSQVNVRSGPDTIYETVGALSTGATASVSGKNNDGTWWVIDFPPGPGGHGWVAANAVSAWCIPGSLAVVVAPPTPLP